MLAFRNALVAIANADGGVLAITERDTKNMVAWANIGALPDEGIAYLVMAEPTIGKLGKQISVTVQFSCFAKTLSRAETLARRIQDSEQPTLATSGMYTANAFQAQGLQAHMVGITGGGDRSALEQDGGRKEHRIDVEAVFEVVVS